MKEIEYNMEIPDLEQDATLDVTGGGTSGQIFFPKGNSYMRTLVLKKRIHMVLGLIKGLSHGKAEVHFSIHRKPMRPLVPFPDSLRARKELNPIRAPNQKTLD